MAALLISLLVSSRIHYSAVTVGWFSLKLKIRHLSSSTVMMNIISCYSRQCLSGAVWKACFDFRDLSEVYGVLVSPLLSLTTGTVCKLLVDYDKILFFLMVQPQFLCRHAVTAYTLWHTVLSLYLICSPAVAMDPLSLSSCLFSYF